MKLVKFGGSSVASAERIKHIIDLILLTDRTRKYAVFSTFGKKDSNDIKITDQLEQIAAQFYNTGEYPKERVEKIRNKYYTETQALGLDTNFLDKQFEELERIIKNKLEPFDRYYSAIVAQGERLFVSIPAEYLKSRGLNAVAVYPEKCGLITDSNYRNATVLPGALANVKKYITAIKADFICFPGFYAVDKNGDFTTFRRGGSDFTGALLSNALDVELYENFTDVNGILRVDPTLFKDEDITVETIEIISYREVRELAYGGAKVIHSGTLKPLSEKKIPLRIRNTFDIANPGTLVVSQKERTYEVVKGIAARDRIYFLNVHKDDMDNEHGIGFEIEKILLENKISFTQITSSIDSLSYAIAEPDFIDELDKSKFEQNLENAIYAIKNSEVISPQSVTKLYPFSLVYIVGEGMNNTIGLLAKFTKILSKNNINIYTVYQAPEQLNVIFGVAQADSKRAVKELYKALFVDKSNLELSIASDSIMVAFKSIALNYCRKELGQISAEVSVDLKANKAIFEFSKIFSEAEKKFITKNEDLENFKKMKESVIAKTKPIFKQMLETAIKNNKIVSIYFEINLELNEQIFFVNFEKNLI